MTHRNVVAMQHAESGVGAALHLEIVENVVAAIVDAEHVIPRAKEAAINHLSRLRMLSTQCAYRPRLARRVRDGDGRSRRAGRGKVKRRRRSMRAGKQID